MPELPDIEAYLSALHKRILGQSLEHVRIASAFLLRTAHPPLEAVEGKRVLGLRRIGKRIAIGVEEELWLVLHLMIAGRLHWKSKGSKLSGRQNLAAFDFSNGTLLLTEAGSKRRASLHVVAGESGLKELDPGGLEVLGASYEAFHQALTQVNRTLKRALTDPRVFSGIGNAYSDEILHHALLSPLAQTQKLSDTECKQLFESCQTTLELWSNRLQAESSANFPEKVTAFRKDMAVHGRFGLPCPRCAEPVQRIRYADNETNYCANCQTSGKILADRGLSRLLGADWPRTLEELEALRNR